jgi:hypothetical protein
MKAAFCLAGSRVLSIQALYELALEAIKLCTVKKLARTVHQGQPFAYHAQSFLTLANLPRSARLERQAQDEDSFESH